MKTENHRFKVPELASCQQPVRVSPRPPWRELAFMTVLGLTSVLTLHAAPVQWPPSQGGNGHWYEAVVVETNGITWAAAKAAAEAAGGHLATITSTSENGFVYALVATNEPCWQGGEPWLGGFQPNGSQEPAGGWRWVTSEPWAFTNWEAGEPNNFSGPENFLAFWAAPSARSSQWNDTQDVPMPSFIIEWESPPPLDFTEGLLAYFPFEGNADDASGNGNDGNLIGGVAFVPGVVGSAAHFSGSGAHIQCNNTLGNFEQSDFTISGWIRTPTGGALVSKRTSCDCGINYLDVRVGRSNNPGPLPQNVLFEVCGGGGSYAYVEGPLIYTNATWHHVTVIRKGTELFSYVDGVEVGRDTSTQIADIQNLASLRIGRSACSGVDSTPEFDGEIDEVRIYDRALSSFEILALNAFGGPAVISPPKSQTVSPGATTSFSVSALGTLPMNYQWFFNGNPLPGQNSPILNLTGIQTAQAGLYSVSVTNIVGSTNEAAILSVLDLKMFAGLILAGPVGTNYKIEYLPAIDGTNTWQTFTNVTLTTSPSVFFDMDSPGHQQRFYRAIPLP